LGIDSDLVVRIPNGNSHMQLHWVMHFGGLTIFLLDDDRRFFIGIRLSTHIIFVFPALGNNTLIPVLVEVCLESIFLIRSLDKTGSMSSFLKTLCYYQRNRLTVEMNELVIKKLQPPDRLRGIGFETRRSRRVERRDDGQYSGTPFGSF